MHKAPRSAYFLALMFALLYIYSVSISNNSIISKQAHFLVDAPFKFRFLLPVIFDGIFPERFIDRKIFHFLVCVIFTAWAFKLLPQFAQKIAGQDWSLENTVLLRAGFFVILIMHYCMPRELNVYYVYDIPAIAFYIICFTQLTKHKDDISAVAIGITVLASLNRETAIIAPLHALAFQIAQNPRLAIFMKTHKKTIAKLTLTFILILGTRFLINQLLGASSADNAAPMEGHRLRLLGNIDRVLHDKNHIAQFFMLGCGIVLWLPFTYRGLPRPLKYMLASTLPVLVIFLWAGNITELRMYNELTPLIALAFFFAILNRWHPPQHIAAN